MFDAVYCIHLPNAERKARIDAEIAEAGIKILPRFIHANQPRGDFSMTNMRRNARAEFGVNLSHAKAVVHAIANGGGTPLFIEDDVALSDYFLKDLDRAACSLPMDWDILYLGGHPRGPIMKISERLVKVSSFCFAEAYIVNGINNLGGLFDAWCDRISQPNAMYDFILSDWASTVNAYACYPCLTEQYVGFSQVGNKIDDKRELVKRGWANHLK